MKLITNKKLINLLILVVCFIFVMAFIFLLTYFIKNNQRENNIIKNNVISNDVVFPKIIINGNISEIPEITMPVKYFSEKNIEHGSQSDNNKWAEASLNEMAYQSYPTTSISLPLADYSNDAKSLGIKKSWNDIVKENNICGKSGNEDCGFIEQIKQNYNEYKDLAPFYLPVESIYTEKFDVDGDKKDETIIFGCGIGGNHCPHNFDIVKDNKIIFSAGLSGVNIKPTETGNGFYLEWNNDEDLTGGYCCPWGYVRTKFVYENNKFIPVLEQKVYYLRIKDSK